MPKRDVPGLARRMVHGPIFVENPDGSITEARCFLGIVEYSIVQHSIV